MAAPAIAAGGDALGTGDSRAVVRAGLRRVVAACGEPPADAAGLRAWTNRLLDETGSDRRGLVQLLLRLRADGVAAAIPRGPLSSEQWAPARARLAFGYAAATYLDAEMARWAVDAWAYALGVVGEDALWAPPPDAAVPSVARRPDRVAPQGPSPVVPAGRRVPGRARRAAARAYAPAIHNPFPANFDRLAGYAFAALFVAASVAMWVGIVARREAGGLEVPTPRASEDRSVARSSGAAGGGAAAPAPRATTRTVSAREDTLRLRDGTVRTGRIERLTKAAVLLRDPWSDAVDAVALDDVLELRPGGAPLPVGGTATPTPRDVLGRPLPNELGGGARIEEGGAAATRATGFGGRYAVRQELVEMAGSESCDAVAAAVREAAAEATVETVVHTPGADTFALASRAGVRGTVDPDGEFRTVPIHGARDGVHYWFRMSGRFDARGFRASAESATDAVLKYGSVQRCRVVADLEARRLP